MGKFQFLKEYTGNRGKRVKANKFEKDLEDWFDKVQDRQTKKYNELNIFTGDEVDEDTLEAIGCVKDGQCNLQKTSFRQMIKTVLDSED